MNPLALLGGLLAYNYRRHLVGKPTICSTGRSLLPWWVLIPAVSVGFCWLAPHLKRGYVSRT